jgi:hypothetical protein
LQVGASGRREIVTASEKLVRCDSLSKTGQRNGAGYVSMIGGPGASSRRSSQGGPGATSPAPGPLALNLLASCGDLNPLAISGASLIRSAAGEYIPPGGVVLFTRQGRGFGRSGNLRPRSIFDNPLGRTVDCAFG